MRKVKPILLNEQTIIKLAKDIISYNKQVLFQPLVDIFKHVFNSNIKLNAVKYPTGYSAIREAIKDEKIYYENGYFKGSFNSKIVKELKDLGAVFKKGVGYRLEKELPVSLIDVLVEKKEKMRQALHTMDDLLNEMLNNLQNEFLDNTVVDFKDTITNYREQYKDNFNQFKIKVNIDEKQEKELNEKYTLDTNILIKNFTIKQINDLRAKIKKYVLDEGYSSTYIKKLLINDYELSQNRAVLIARQESNLLMAEYTRERYSNLGIKKFEWQTAGDRKVRDSHQELDGKIFDFNNPPIINKDTGERGLPGQAVNCRCVMVPVLDDEE